VVFVSRCVAAWWPRRPVDGSHCPHTHTHNSNEVKQLDTVIVLLRVGLVAANGPFSALQVCVEPE
jgi:hypothetical protein